MRGYIRLTFLHAVIYSRVLEASLCRFHTVGAIALCGGFSSRSGPDSETLIALLRLPSIFAMGRPIKGLEQKVSDEGREIQGPDRATFKWWK